MDVDRDAAERQLVGGTLLLLGAFGAEASRSSISPLPLIGSPLIFASTPFASVTNTRPPSTRTRPAFAGMLPGGSDTLSFGDVPIVLMPGSRKWRPETLNQPSGAFRSVSRLSRQVCVSTAS